MQSQPQQQRQAHHQQLRALLLRLKASKKTRNQPRTQMLSITRSKFALSTVNLRRFVVWSLNFCCCSSVGSDVKTYDVDMVHKDVTSWLLLRKQIISVFYSSLPCFSPQQMTVKQVITKLGELYPAQRYRVFKEAVVEGHKIEQSKTLKQCMLVSSEFSQATLVLLPM